MTIQLDHFFILTETGAPEAELVSGTGLIEGAANDHPGQGTSNRRFFLSNSTLELLYIRNEDEARNGRASRLRFADRRDSAGASPFGLVLKSDSESGERPFPGWPYCPEYFSADQCFHVGENSDLLQEPLCICMPANLSRPGKPEHTENAHWTLTELHISVPVPHPSRTLETVSKCDGLSLHLNQPHKLELVFNDEASGRLLDLAPNLPLVLRW